MIVVCGGLADTITELVCARLVDSGYPFRFLDLGTYPAGFELSWEWRRDLLTGYLAGPGWRLDLDAIRSVYVRFPTPDARAPPPRVRAALAATAHAEWDAGLTALLEHLPCPVVNRLNGSMSNHSKPYQALLIRRCGLRTPPSLVTDDPGAARRFIGEHREVIYKSVSGLRSIVRRVGAEQMRRLPLLRHGPTQFQRFIPGENIRVHAVANRLFATRIASDQVDYRYVPDGARPPEMAPVELPPAIAAACLKLMRHLDLLFAGIDLKRTPDGDYYCFEVNPSPAFLFYERGAGQPISAALADLLQGGPSPRGP